MAKYGWYYGEKSPITILILYHEFAGSNIGEYPVFPVIGQLTASCFVPRIADTGWPIIGTLSNSWFAPKITLAGCFFELPV